MPLARSCDCPRPRIFADSPETCHRCGRQSPRAVGPGIMRLALTIAEVRFGYRRLYSSKMAWADHPIIDRSPRLVSRRKTA